MKIKVYISKDVSEEYAADGAIIQSNNNLDVYKKNEKGYRKTIALFNFNNIIGFSVVEE